MNSFQFYDNLPANGRLRYSSTVFIGYGSTSSDSQSHNFPAYALPVYSGQYPNIPIQAAQPTPENAQPGLLDDGELAISTQEQSSSRTPVFLRSLHRQLPQIIFYSPPRGVHGTKIFVYIRSRYDLECPQQYNFNIMFGTKRCDAKLTKIDHCDDSLQYAVAADIPPFESTEWIESQVPLCLSMQDEQGQSVAMVEVGDFTYLNAHSYLNTGNVTASSSRKRKLSESPGGLQQPLPKRVASQPLLAEPRGQTGLRAHSSGPKISYASQDAQASFQSTSYRSIAPQGSLRFDQMGFVPHQTAHGNPMTFSHDKTPLGSDYRFYSTGIMPTEQSPIVNVGPGSTRKQILSTPSSTSNPPLIRTSALGESGSSVQAFNPYAMYSNAKAQLKLDGDLDKMTEDWTPEECNVRRRVVQFRRSQSGSVITAFFKPVWTTERAPNSICVSCIWWEKKQECFATSVDTIHLLEALVAVRFTVEEKNRIRRNLEGFRPMTVSKGKADSENFFKLIMGFPNPKPRNIEKDVKVFPWKILTHALKKIISKYVCLKILL